MTTLPIHPVQLYEIGLNVLLAVFLWHFRTRLRRRGSAFLAYCAGYSLIRFMTEFFRADGTALLGGLKVVQLSVGIVFLLSVILLVRRELFTASAADISSEKSTEPAPERLAVLIGILTVVIFVGTRWFTPLEISVIVTLAVAVVIAFVLHRFSRSRLLATPCVASVLFIVQPIPAVPDTTDIPGSHHIVGISYSSGKYWWEDCGGSRRYNDFSTHGASYTYKYLAKRYTSYSIGVNYHRGTDTERGYVPEDREKLRSMGLKAQADWHYFGLGLGANADNDVGLLPIVHLRAGPLSGMYLEGRITDHEAAPLPYPGATFGVGLGFSNGSNLRFGFSGSGGYVGGALVLNDQWEIHPFYAKKDDNFKMFSLALRMRLGTRQRTP